MIGINAQIRSDSGNAEGVGFAIPINSARRSMVQLISTGKVAYAYVGVTTQDVTPAHLAPVRARCAARRADPGGRRGCAGRARRACADRPTQKVVNGVPINIGGDLIVGFAGHKVERAADIASIVTDSLLPGQTVSVTVLRRRQGQARDRARPPDRAAGQPDPLTLPGLARTDSGKDE